MDYVVKTNPCPAISGRLFNIRVQLYQKSALTYIHSKYIKLNNFHSVGLADWTILHQIDCLELRESVILAMEIISVWFSLEVIRYR